MLQRAAHLTLTAMLAGPSLLAQQNTELEAEIAKLQATIRKLGLLPPETAGVGGQILQLDAGGLALSAFSDGRGAENPQ